MKNILTINGWKAIAFLVVVIFFFSCKTGDDGPSDPTNPTDSIVTPVIQPRVSIGTASNVTANSAVLDAWITSNGNTVKVSLDYKTTTDGSWKNLPLASTINQTDSVKVTFNLLDLTKDSQYLFRVKANNVISDTAKFSTLIVKDHDGNAYHVIQIGTQFWLQENLKATHYINGDALKNPDVIYWTGTSDDSYCYYNGDANLGKIYGALYNYKAATDSRGFITGYHVPSATEFETLQTYLGGEKEAGLKMMEKGTEHWNWADYDHRKKNSSGFTGLGAGSTYVGYVSSFTNLKGRGNFSTTSEGEFDQYSCVFALDYGTMVSYFYKSNSYKPCGNSIRLIKN